MWKCSKSVVFVSKYCISDTYEKDLFLQQQQKNNKKLTLMSHSDIDTIGAGQKLLLKQLETVAVGNTDVLMQIYALC